MDLVLLVVLAVFARAFGAFLAVLGASLSVLGALLAVLGALAALPRCSGRCDGAEAAGHRGGVIVGYAILPVV